MNAVQLLIKDHDEFRDLFKQFAEAGPKAHKKKQAIADKLIKELVAHAQIEEQIFYPAMTEKGDQEIKDKILEGIEEHRIADFMMTRLRKAQPEEDIYDARFQVLSESVTHHIEEEEKSIFPKAKKILKDDLDRLGEAMEALEKRLEGEA